MRYELKSIGIWAYIKVAFLLNLVFCFLIGLLCTAMLPLLLIPLESLPLLDAPGLDIGEFPFAVFLLIMPFFAIGGAVFLTTMGVIIVFFYNLIARLVGGIEMDLEEVNHVPESMPPTGPMTAYSSLGQPPPPPPGPVTNPPPEPKQ